MKKKFDLKLTACLVSLFISIALIIFFNENKVVMAISFVLLAITLYFFGKIRLKKIDSTLEKTDEDIQELYASGEIEDVDLTEVHAQMKQLRKQRKSVKVVFNLAPILFVIVALLMVL